MTFGEWWGYVKEDRVGQVAILLDLVLVIIALGMR